MEALCSGLKSQASFISRYLHFLVSPLNIVGAVLGVMPSKQWGFSSFKMLLSFKLLHSIADWIYSGIAPSRGPEYHRAAQGVRLGVKMILHTFH